ncbi:bis(5'-nucleosyl)-tetraphosphatase (symmetrical) YqeK [Tuberibacillus sp. Marseille-P3662]|uniref:bis(5'-nucleosyl)-tetraphosphatase (symmetrical) YqeK n=1 Tax=Tuberibacillus sp. Marseille-P3662 TaxID=1965358 RepID=UPI000A1CA4BE|nr:bis(5'-nucleosyl)-tetraphosphatase (symmetrical) YqeK [Tuberibacillus sp. Marseille-P3662]
MNKQEALQVVQEILPEHRFEHTKRVVETAKQLAGRNDADIDKVTYAAIWHDIAKYFDEDYMYEIIYTHPEIPNELLNYHVSLWHAPVGSVYVRETYNLLDQDVLNGMTYHTTGRAGMSTLEKIVFLADYIEPGRAFPGIDEVRHLAETDLDAAVCQSLANTIQFLVAKNAQVHPDTVDAYNELIKNKEEHE